MLIITDGAPGLISAIEQVFDRSLRQRCLIHRARNIIAKVSSGDQDEVKADYWSIFDDIEGEPGAAHWPRRGRGPTRSQTSGAARIPARWHA